MPGGQRVRLVVWIAVVILVGCGPRGAGPTPPAGSGKSAALIAVAPDAATLDQMITALAPLGGEHLGVLRFAPPDARWPTAELAQRGIRADAPLGLAITAEGVVVHWAAVGDVGRLRAALDAVPGAARWRADQAELWRFGDQAVGVIAGGRAAILTGGAASRRDRIALEVASGALEIAAEPVAGRLRLDVDGAFVIDTFVPEPGPIMTRLGVDLGRIRIELVGASDHVAVDVELHPAKDTFAERVIAGAHNPGMVTPSALFAVSTRVPPAEALALLTELGQRLHLDVAALSPGGREPVSVLTGELALAPGAIAVKFVDAEVMYDIAALIPQLVTDRAQPDRSFTIGARTAGRAGGISLQPEVFAIQPVVPPDPGPIPALEDENTDVPWSLDYRDARKALEQGLDALASAITARNGVLYTTRTDWARELGAALEIGLAPAAGGYRGHGEWRPESGTIAAQVEHAGAGFADITRHAGDISRAHAAALAARQHALEIRAHDVAAWDRDHHP